MNDCNDIGDPAELVAQLRRWAEELGFASLGISDIDLARHEERLQRWLEAGLHGEMDWMAAHGRKRSRPAELVPGTCRVLSLRMDYLPAGTDPVRVLEDPGKAYVARYTLGRDYHKVMRRQCRWCGPG